MSFVSCMLNRQVALVRVRVIKVLLHVQCEWQDRTEARESLIIKSLPTELILRTSCHTRSHTPAGQIAETGTTGRTDRSLKHLHGIEQRRLRRAAGSQNSLLLLHRIGDIGVERDRQQRVIIEDSKRCANHMSFRCSSDPTQQPIAAPSCFCREGNLVALPLHLVLQVIQLQRD